MKYLSVDLEACNMFVKGSVFSVGMVLADENFNIIFKRNYWINPLCRFAMKFRKPIDFKIKKAPSIGRMRCFTKEWWSRCAIPTNPESSSKSPIFPVFASVRVLYGTFLRAFFSEKTGKKWAKILSFGEKTGKKWGSFLRL